VQNSYVMAASSDASQGPAQLLIGPNCLLLEDMYKVAQNIWHNYFVRLNFTKY